MKTTWVVVACIACSAVVAGLTAWGVSAYQERHSPMAKMAAAFDRKPTAQEEAAWAECERQQNQELADITRANQQAAQDLQRQTDYQLQKMQESQPEPKGF